MSLEQPSANTKRPYPVIFGTFTSVRDRERVARAREAVHVLTEWQATIERATRPSLGGLWYRHQLQRCAVADAAAVLAGNRW